MSPFDHPLVRAAVERESEVRDAAFLGLPYPIEGQNLQPLTLRHYLTLQLAGNAFVCGGSPVASDAAMFLYVMTGAAGSRSAYAESIAGLDFVSVCQGLVSFLNESFFDAPASTNEGAG